MRRAVDRRADLTLLDAPRIAVHDQQRRPTGLRVSVRVGRYVGDDHDPVGAVPAGHEGFPPGHREARLTPSSSVHGTACVRCAPGASVKPNAALR